MKAAYPASCLIVSETYLPLFGGAEMYTYNFANQLAKNGVQVTIATYTAGEIPDAYRVPGLRILHLEKPRKHEVRKFAVLIRQLWKEMKAHELVVANYTNVLAALSVLLSIPLSKRVLVLAHGFGTIIDKEHPRIFRLYRYLALTLSGFVVTTSAEIEDIVRAYTPRVTVATAVDFSKIDAHQASARAEEASSLHPGTRKVLTIRRLVEKNGIQYLIEAVPYLARIRQDFICLIAGDGRLRNKLEARVDELGIRPYVSFLGEVENNQVFGLIRSADAVVFPSSAEALSLAAIECMYIGTPLVVSNVGGLRELAGESGERATSVDLFGRTMSVYQGPQIEEVPAERYEALARAIDAALTRDARIEEKVRAAQAYVAGRFDWPKVAERIITFAGQR